VPSEPPPERHPLERLLCTRDAPPLVEEPAGGERGGAQVRAAGGRRWQWLEGDGWKVFATTSARREQRRGRELAAFTTRDGERLVVAHDADDQVVSVPFGLADAYLGYVAERWREGAAPTGLTSGQLALFYRVKPLIPRRVQLAARRALMRRQTNPAFPRWPLDSSVERLIRLVGRCLLTAAGRTELPFRWFWPAPHRFAAILTHDVESADGLELALELADLEEERGFRSSFNVVADWYPVDEGILRELRRRGFEVGVHGIRHDRSMFSSRTAFEAQLPLVRTAADRFEADGFRSPATHRVFEWLGELPIRYDCTIPNSDPFEPQPGGCCSAWPFFVGDVVELPWTLPQDHTLFTLLGHDSIDVWREQVDSLSESGGLVQVLTHPDPGYLGDPRKRALYAEFLDALRERRDMWSPLPREVAAWWRDRDRGESERFELTDGRLVLDDSPDGAAFLPPRPADPQAAYL
jgi:peptidoglycan/xylan/chitin deacetylase (PgdA/CDA1 family)